MNQITITLPHTPRELSPNGRCHWAKKATLVRRARGIAYAVMYSELAGRKLKPTVYDIAWYYKGVKGDADNQLARCKAYLDGACDAMGINDATLNVGSVRIIHDLERAGKVEITFRKEAE